MAIVINGSGTVTGLSVGGLPDGTVDNDTVASGLASSKLTGALPAISGASLTNIPAANITGTLPAIDGSNLTGLSTNTPSFSATHSNTALASSNTWTLVPFSTEVMDNGGCYNPASGQYKFTPAVAGYYQVSSVVNWYASNGNVTNVSVALYKNGSEYISFRSTGYTSNQSAYYVGSSTYSGILYLSASDYLQVYWASAYSSTAPSTNGLGAFSATKVII